MMPTTSDRAPMSPDAARARYVVLVADAVDADGLAPLRDDPRFAIVERPGLKGEELARAVGEADAVIVRSATKIPREALVYAERLKVIGRAGVGVDTIDVEAATERGVAVLNAPAGNTISAAELAFALLLSLARRVPAADASMRAGKWERAKLAGSELYGKTLGLVGAGRIGGEVARRARAFGMRVLVYDPYLNAERARALDVEPAELDALLAESDAISLHVPLTEATQGLIGAERLARLKPGAFLVNAARGGIVDETALVEALRAGRLGGAAFDVYETEPLPADHPLRTLPNVVLTPHLGASTEEAQRNVAREIAEAVRDALTAGDFSRAVNAPAIGGEEAKRLRPLLELAERLGTLAAALAPAPVETVEVRYAGESDAAPGPLAARALVGLLAPVVGRGAVNLVNAPHLARTRGIAVSRARIDQHRDYAEYVELRLTTPAGPVHVAGALLAEGHPRVVRVGNFHVDVVPKGTLVILRNRDVPGVIGRVGTVLGDAGVNIAEYHQARREPGGPALAAVSVDGRLGADVLARLRALPEIEDVRQAEL